MNTEPQREGFLSLPYSPRRKKLYNPRNYSLPRQPLRRNTILRPSSISVTALHDSLPYMDIKITRKDVERDIQRRLDFLKAAKELQNSLRLVVKAADSFRHSFQACASGPTVELGIAEKFKLCASTQMAIFDQLDEMRITLENETIPQLEKRFGVHQNHVKEDEKTFIASVKESKKEMAKLEKASLKLRNCDTHTLETNLNQRKQCIKELENLKIEHFCGIIEEERSVTQYLLNQVSGMLVQPCQGLVKTLPLYTGPIQAVVDGIEPLEEMEISLPKNQTLHEQSTDTKNDEIKSLRYSSTSYSSSILQELADLMNTSSEVVESFEGENLELKELRNVGVPVVENITNNHSEKICIRDTGDNISMEKDEKGVGDESDVEEEAEEFSCDNVAIDTLVQNVNQSSSGSSPKNSELMSQGELLVGAGGVHELKFDRESDYRRWI